MKKSELLQQWYDQVWTNGNLDAIDRLFAPETRANGVIPEFQMDRSDFRDLVAACRQHFGKIRFDLLRTIENGDWLAAALRLRTTRADTGAPIEATGQIMARFQGDRMVETHNHFDFVSLFEQLGQFPPDTLPICLTGQRLTWA